MVKSKTRRDVLFQPERADTAGTRINLKTLGLTPDDPDLQNILSAFIRSDSAGADIFDPAVQAECVAEGRRRHEAARERDAACVVYYLKVNQYIKIGTARDLKSRLGAYPPGTRVLATEPGSYRLETARLLEFQEYLAARREWFRPGPRLVAHINDLRRAQLAEAS